MKPRRVVEIQRFTQKPFLENETEVEDFLSKLRTALHDAIAKNEHIQFKSRRIKIPRPRMSPG